VHNTAERTALFSEAAQAAAQIEIQLQHNAATLRQLAQRLQASPPRAVVTCARGSSDHAATFAKYLIETRLGILVSSAAPSISSLYAAEPRLEDTLLLAISQSGASPDLLATVERARRAGAFVVAAVNVESSPLAQAADCTLPLCAGPERSVAATKSYLASLAAILQLVTLWSGDSTLESALAELPQRLQRAWDTDWSAALQVLRDAGNLYVLGRGLGLAIAQEAALKLKETCALHAEALSAAEVLHGPMALVTAGFPVLMFAQADETHQGVQALAAELVARRARVLLAGARTNGALVLASQNTHPAIQPLLLIQSFYRLVNALSVARGLDPDNPPHLRKVTETV
jgi:glutamine---fructose-6-phosphate transaminase (isomerizing)